MASGSSHSLQTIWRIIEPNRRAAVTKSFADFSKNKSSNMGTSTNCTIYADWLCWLALFNDECWVCTRAARSSLCPKSKTAGRQKYHAGCPILLKLGRLYSHLTEIRFDAYVFVSSLLATWPSSNLSLPYVNKKLIRRWDTRTWHRSILLHLLRLTPPTEGFLWDDVRKILRGGQRMAKVQSGEDILPKVSTPE